MCIGEIQTEFTGIPRLTTQNSTDVILHIIPQAIGIAIGTPVPPAVAPALLMLPVRPVVVREVNPVLPAVERALSLARSVAEAVKSEENQPALPVAVAVLSK